MAADEDDLRAWGNLPNFVCRFQSIHHWHDEVEQYDGQRAQNANFNTAAGDWNNPLNWRPCSKRERRITPRRNRV